jgi:hypothetical protein
MKLQRTQPYLGKQRFPGKNGSFRMLTYLRMHKTRETTKNALRVTNHLFLIPRKIQKLQILCGVQI